MEDHELLSEYVERRSDQAFAALVERHIDLVYSTALRSVQDPHLAPGDCPEGLHSASSLIPAECA